MSKNIEIINYRPDLKMDYTPSLNPVYNEKANEQINLTYAQEPLSICLSEFKESLPSSTLSSVEEVTQRIVDSMSILAQRMSESKKGKEFLDSTGEERDTIISQNYNDPYGSTYIEAYVELDNIKSELEILKSDYSRFTYGDDINYDEAKLIDDSFVEKLTALESEGETNDIGYTSLYFETMISNMINLYTHRIGDEALPYITDMSEECKTMPFGDKYIQLLLNNFQKKQETLKNDVFKDEKTAYNIKVALKNTFLALQEYEDSLSAVDGLDAAVDNRELGLEIKTDALGNLSNSLLELMHILYYSPIAKSDIANSLRSKSNIREYFIE